MKRMSLLLSAVVLSARCAAAQTDEVPATGVQSAETQRFSFVTTLAQDDQDTEARAEAESLAEETTSEPQESSSSKTEKTTVISQNGVTVEVHASSESEDDQQTDGEGESGPKRKTKAKIVVIGPDGERKEYELSGDDATSVIGLNADGEGNAEAHASGNISIVTSDDGETSYQWTPNEQESERVAIGVQCDEPDEALRSHLKLDGRGLIVELVREETPASEAGLQKLDVIVQIDGKDVTSRDDLISVVSAAEGKPLALSVIRAGEPLSISVTPRRMKVPVVVESNDFRFQSNWPGPNLQGIQRFAHSGQLGELSKLSEHPEIKALPEDVRKKIEELLKVAAGANTFHPGILLNVKPGDKAEMKKLLEHYRDAADKFRDAADKHEHAGELDKAKQELRESLKAIAGARSASADASKLHESLQQMQKQMEAMQQQMEELKKQLAEESDDPK